MKMFVVVLIGAVIATAILTFDFACEKEILKAAHDVKAISAGMAQGMMGVNCLGFILILILALFEDN